ncbi:MAG: aldose 1-epimerase family protein [Spirochaetales bacterium]|nr:aldose 1-epimerase family protein [Spirochaetales bacterium]
MGNFIISNNKITAEFKSLGAELTSLKDSDGHEYLWQGHPDHWTGQSPLLFPIIGGLENDSYDYAGKTWNMKSHGFARKSEWVLECRDRNSIIFNLKSNAETMKNYPFEFKVSLIYSIHDNCLEVEYEVWNMDKKSLPFQIGGHPAFNCPIEGNKRFSDYRLKLGKKETSRTLLKKTILTGETAPCLENSDTIDLNHNLFDNGALIFRDLVSLRITLETNDSTGKKITMEFPGFTHFGIWKKPKTDAPFICLEPWYGVDSTEGGPGEIEKKEGIINLEPSGIFKAGYRIILE